LELSNRLEEIQAQSQSSGSHYTLLFVNIDHFRAFNDEFGHQSGDDVLIVLANTLLEVTKDQDVVSRIASDEFLILLPNTDEKLISQLAIRFCKAAEKKLHQNGWNLTLSHGYTDDIGKSRNLEDLMRRATENLKNNRKIINSIQAEE